MANGRRSLGQPLRSLGRVLARPFRRPTAFVRRQIGHLTDDSRRTTKLAIRLVIGLLAAVGTSNVLALAATRTSGVSGQNVTCDGQYRAVGSGSSDFRDGPVLYLSVEGTDRPRDTLVPKSRGLRLPFRTHDNIDPVLRLQATAPRGLPRTLVVGDPTGITDFLRATVYTALTESDGSDLGSIETAVLQKRYFSSRESVHEELRGEYASTPITHQLLLLTSTARYPAVRWGGYFSSAIVPDADVESDSDDLRFTSVRLRCSRFFEVGWRWSGSDPDELIANDVALQLSVAIGRSEQEAIIASVIFWCILTVFVVEWAARSGPWMSLLFLLLGLLGLANAYSSFVIQPGVNAVSLLMVLTGTICIWRSGFVPRPY